MDREFSELEDALNCLSDKQRAAYVLRRYGKFSYREIARLLNCEVGTVSSTISEARIKLRDKLREIIANADQQVLKY